LAEWAKARGHQVETVELGLGNALPALDDFDGLALLGGPMSVNDEAVYTWLRPEKALVREAVAARKRVLGICLGAQMIASALGATVRGNPHTEIGWFPVESTPAGARHPLWSPFPRAHPVFHWHGETFDLPQGAIHLARSAACEHQAFAVGNRTLGLQCHFEVDGAALGVMVKEGAEELDARLPFVQSGDIIVGQHELLDRTKALGWSLWDAWAEGS
jgi:GMP synthase-like glutamine amidotransferase